MISCNDKKLKVLKLSGEKLLQVLRLTCVKSKLIHPQNHSLHWGGGLLHHRSKAHLKN